MTRSQEFIKRNAKILVGASDYFNVDSTLMRAEEFDTAKLKVMFVFPSPATDKAVSLTAAVINDFILTKCPGVFVDFAYIPHQKDYKLFDKERISYAVGSITHLDASHFDVVGFSMSILYEAISTAWICNTFNRCDTPIPLTWSERKDLPFGKVPILCGGGIVSSLADILFGDIGDGRKAFLDFIHLGEIHCIKPFYDYLISVKDKGVPVQKVIDTFWESEHDSSWLYQPQAYDVEYNDRNQIIKNIKINPSAPDMCKPYFPDEMPDCLESARGIIMGTGKNAGLGQIHAANGCSRSGFCNFSVASNTLLCTEKGVLDISRVESGVPMELQSAGIVSCKGVVPQQSETVYRVKLESGLFLDCSINHKWIRRTHGDRLYTTKQIRNILYRGGSFEVLRKVGNHFNIKESHVAPLVEEIISYSKLIDLRANISSAGPVVWTKNGFRYRTEYKSGDNSSEIAVNRLATCLNFVGYDTTVCSDPFGILCIYFWPVANSVVHDKVISVTRMDYKDLMYDVVETTDHTVCYNSIITSNCHEASYSGGWVENSPERLVELAKACRKYTAATILKGFSFNSNYLSDYKRNIYDWLDIFPKVTFNNMRLEELGLDRDALKMMQLAGYQRMTAPIEGVSRRIRNNLLNKNLSDKSLDAYLEYGMMMGAVDCKVGIINTGYEEEEDWKEFIDFNIKWQNKCKELGGSIPFRYKGTVLVHQPHTPMEYMERKSIRLAYYGDKFMPDLWNDERLNIRFQINGFKHSSFIEQAILDLGRSLTSWMYQRIILKNIPMYSFRPIATHKEVFESLRDKINVDYFFNRREFDEYISVVHRVHIAMHANVILQAKKIMEKGVNASPTIRCLKTYDGCSLECKVNSFAKDPIVVYGDVWKKEDGKLDGVVWEDVKGCRRCKTPEDRKKVMGRVLPKSKNADDILTHKAPSIVLKLRFILYRNADFQYLNPRYTQFAFFAKFLQMSDELCEYFWEVENAHNLLWQSEDGAVYPMVGTQIVDVRFKDRKAFDLVKSLIPEINQDAKSFKVVDVFEVPVDDKIKSDYYNLFYFESSIPAELWHFLSSEYKGEVKVVGASGSVETIQDEKLKSPDFVLKDKVKGYFLIPCRYSPWNYLQGLMSRKRMSVNKILKTTDISCVSVFKESNVPCLCGKEAALVDVRTGKLQKVGMSCMTKLLVSRL